MSAVLVRSVAVAYGGREVLSDVSLAVEPGTVVAILGANGSGKSTLVRAVLGLVPVSRGDIELFGVPRRRFRDWARVGYVPQRLGAGSGVPATVGEVVAAGRLARRGIFRLPGGADRAAVRAALADVGLTDRAGDPVSTLSGGQQQRTLIARALAGEPDLLILDEPTAGVDAASQEAFAGTLRRFQERGGTVLLVAHELGPIEPLIDRAVVVHGGRIAYDGAVPEPAGHHAEPGHDHVHPHAVEERPGICVAPTDRVANKVDLLQYDFMLRALAGALIIGVTAPALGIYLVQRRLSLIGDGIGHVALTGVGVGLLFHRSPVITAVIVAAIGAVAVELVRERGRTSGDLALALLFYGGIAGGVVLVGLSEDSGSANLVQYLFGSLTTTSGADLAVIAVLGVAVLGAMLLLRPVLFAVCDDEEYARVSGLPVRTLNLLMAVTTAVTVTIAMRTVGLLLVSALMVVPVAAAQQVTRGFRTTMAVAMGVGLVAAASGVLVSAEIDTAPGATIVILALAVFLALTAAGALRRNKKIHETAEPPDVVLHG